MFNVVEVANYDLNLVPAHLMFYHFQLTLLYIIRQLFSSAGAGLLCRLQPGWRGRGRGGGRGSPWRRSRPLGGLGAGAGGGPGRHRPAQHPGAGDRGHPRIHPLSHHPPHLRRVSWITKKYLTISQKISIFTRKRREVASDT